MLQGRVQDHRSVSVGFGFLFCLLGAACVPGTLAPPVRPSVNLAPEPLGRGRASTAASFSHAGFGGIFSGGGAAMPSLRQQVGITRWMNLDLDASANVDDRATVIMGSAGLRLFPVQTRYFKLGFAVGAGLGCGGFVEADSDENMRNPCLSAEHRRLAGGGYLGVDLGVRLGRHAAIYQMNRYHLAAATGVPVTHWLHVGLGFQVDFGPDSLVFLSVEGGFGAYWNRADHRYGFVMSYALGFRYGRVRKAVSP